MKHNEKGGKNVANTQVLHLTKKFKFDLLRLRNIHPNISLINLISIFFPNNQRFIFDKLPTSVEQSQDLMLRANVSFPIATYLGSFFSFNHFFRIHFCPLLFLCLCYVPSGYVFVTDTFSTQTVT